jgi:hypothetical protein
MAVQTTERFENLSKSPFCYLVFSEENRSCPRRTLDGQANDGRSSYKDKFKKALQTTERFENLTRTFGVLSLKKHLIAKRLSTMAALLVLMAPWGQRHCERGVQQHTSARRVIRMTGNVVATATADMAASARHCVNPTAARGRERYQGGVSAPWDPPLQLELDPDSRYLAHHSGPPPSAH